MQHQEDQSSHFLDPRFTQDNMGLELFLFTKSEIEFDGLIRGTRHHANGGEARQGLVIAVIGGAEKLCMFEEKQDDNGAQ